MLARQELQGKVRGEGALGRTLLPAESANYSASRAAGSGWDAQPSTHRQRDQPDLRLVRARRPGVAGECAGRVGKGRGVQSKGKGS